MKAAFVPQGKPRGPLGGFPKQSPVREPGLDARGAGAVESSPASQLSSGTEAPATRIGPGGWKVAWEDGKYSKRLSHLLRTILEKAAREADGEPVHRGAFQQGSRLTLPVQPGATEATHTAGAAGAEGEGRGNGREDQVLLKYCLALTAALVVSMLAAMIACCLLIRRWRQSNQCLAAADGAQHDVRGYSLPSEGRPAFLKGPGRWR
ncbi:uncharacterized protein LOC116240202 [Phasianus colchicus]|uniref:uncharacterized protein LOC116240202 n=1 Tax=Phasianus colchicus TaxID=9054 RepID=UPI00129DC248|nr:uncharacterized protein LOC116240202 [Phasianus colchicus]